MPRPWTYYNSQVVKHTADKYVCGRQVCFFPGALFRTRRSRCCSSGCSISVGITAFPTRRVSLTIVTRRDGIFFASECGRAARVGAPGERRGPHERGGRHRTAEGESHSAVAHPTPTPPSCHAPAPPHLNQGARTNGARSHLQVIYTGQLNNDASDGESSTPPRIKAFAARRSFARARKGPEVCRVPPPPPAALAATAHTAPQPHTARGTSHLSRDVGTAAAHALIFYLTSPFHHAFTYLSHAPSHTHIQL